MFRFKSLQKRIAQEVITEAIIERKGLAFINGLLTMALELGLITKSEKNDYWLEALRMN